MKKAIISIAIISLFLCFITVFKNKENKNENITSLSVEEKIETLMSYMTIEEKVAQMLIVNYPKNIVNEQLKENLKKHSYGGFILSKENITTYDNTKKFVTDIKYNSNIPPIIGIDEEGGLVQRLKYLKDVIPTDIPNMYTLGKTSDRKLAYEVGRIIAEELRTIGVNVDFAPVLDVYSNKKNKVIGKRSFSEDYSVVSDMGISLAAGLEENGVIPVFKHFPGHGDTEIDSHKDLPIINKDYDRLKKLELIPFDNAIKNDAKMIMIGHIALPVVTGNNMPATLSKKIITDILKKDMSYDGLVITDALNMGALTKNYSDEEIYKYSIEAGNDLLLMPNNPEYAIKYISNNINEDRIDDSVRKILKFKYYNLTNYKDLDKNYLGNDNHKKIIESIGK